jgi:AcrR family transcriptional regulator
VRAQHRPDPSSAKREQGAKATRRRPAEVRRLVLDAARELFATKGFQGASTSEIASAAGVSESALFRHFETKADLFAAAVVEPFTAFMDEFAGIWERRRDEGRVPGELMREFVSELYDTVQARRGVVKALLATDDDPDHPAFAAARQGFQRMFAEFEAIGKDWSATQGVTIPGLELHERILVGMVTSLALFDRWFLATADGEPLPRERAIDALVDFAEHGAVQADRATQAPARRPKRPRKQ